jgi:hypothetical protein
MDGSASSPASIKRAGSAAGTWTWTMGRFGGSATRALPAGSCRWTILTWLTLPALGGFREVPVSRKARPSAGPDATRAGGRQRGAGPRWGPAARPYANKPHPHRRPSFARHDRRVIQAAVRRQVPGRCLWRAKNSSLRPLPDRLISLASAKISGGVSREDLDAQANISEAR